MNEPNLKYFLGLECIILQQPLCEKIGSFGHVLKVVFGELHAFMSTLTVDCFYLFFFQILTANVRRQCTIQKSDS
jgi:hypothetical protein